MMSRAELLIAHAVLYVERFRFSVLPLGRDKRPSRKWSHLQDSRPTVAEILSWPRENLAIVTGRISDIVVVDCESARDARWFMDHRARKGDRPAIVQTRRGFHLYYRHPGKRIRNAQKVEGRYDVRGDGGYVAAPPSLHSEGAYVWIRPVIEVSALPVFDPAWRPEASGGDVSERVIRDGERYIQHIYARGGNRGHDDTYRAARTLRESGMDEVTALVVLQKWNQTNAEPPWSDRELAHKIRQAFGSAK